MVEPAMGRKGWTIGWLGMDVLGLGLATVAHDHMLRLLIWAGSGGGLAGHGRSVAWLCCSHRAREAGARGLGRQRSGAQG